MSHDRHNSARYENSRCNVSRQNTNKLRHRCIVEQFAIAQRMSIALLKYMSYSYSIRKVQPTESQQLVQQVYMGQTSGSVLHATDSLPAYIARSCLGNRCDKGLRPELDGLRLLIWSSSFDIYLLHRPWIARGNHKWTNELLAMASIIE